MLDIEPGTVVVWGDIGCPWAHLCVFRLHRARTEAGLDEEVTLDMRAFPLEVFNRQPTPKKILDAEISVAGGLDPDAGWQMWQGAESEYPVTMLPALEAVQAAKRQSLRASEELDRALRVALFAQSRTISMRHEILAVAKKCDRVDEAELGRALDTGSARSEVMAQQKQAERDEVKGSPHDFLPDGSDVHNPGLELKWHGEHGEGFPVVVSDDPSVYKGIVIRAAGST
ncbi:MAG TPA: DsbA family protein [Actinomycetota bacterium]|nr:DsbA family protein [Actinomycetota bacterium]